MMVRVVVADDHPLLRRALSRSLRFAGLEVVADTATCDETISAVRDHRPDVLSLDFLMPDGNAFGVLGALRALRSKPRVVVYTGENDGDLRQTLISEGAERVVSKTSASLHTAIRDMLDPDDDAPKGLTLTPREREVLVGFAAGRDKHEIAAKLGMSARTVEVHRRHILGKLQLRNNVELARYALRAGLATL